MVTLLASHPPSVLGIARMLSCVDCRLESETRSKLSCVFTYGGVCSVRGVTYHPVKWTSFSDTTVGS